MSRRRGATFAEEFRLIDQDAYVVRTPGFDKCDASKPTIECDIRKRAVSSGGITWITDEDISRLGYYVKLAGA